MVQSHTDFINWMAKSTICTLFVESDFELGQFDLINWVIILPAFINRKVKHVHLLSKQTNFKQKL